MEKKEKYEKKIIEIKSENEKILKNVEKIMNEINNDKKINEQNIKNFEERIKQKEIELKNKTDLINKYKYDY